MTMWGQAQATVGHLRVRYRGEADMNVAALRLRVERLLDGVDLRPPGMSPGAILIVRSLCSQASIAVLSRISPVEWMEQLRHQMNILYSTATRPAFGLVSGSATSVLFTDGAEMLACLTHDLMAGRARQHWYWQQVLRGIPSAPGPALAALWSAQATQVPAALSYMGETEAQRAIALLSLTEVSTITHALHTGFGLPSHVLAARTPDILPRNGASFDASFAPVPAFAPEPGNALPTAPPWQRVLPSFALPVLIPQARYLLGLALMLHHAPAFARSTRFAEQAAAWLHAELAVPTRKRDMMLEQFSPVSISINEPSPALEQAYSYEPSPTEPSLTPEQAYSDEPSSAPKRIYSDKLISTQERLQLHALDGMQVSMQERLQLHALNSMQDSTARSSTQHSAPAFTDEMALDTTQDLSFDGLPTGLGGVLYLINVLIWLDLPGGWNDAGSLAEHVGGWGIVEALARGLLGALHDRHIDDPLWSVLAALDEREPGVPVGATLPQQAAFRLPAPWVRRYGAAEPAWVALVDTPRLYLFDESAGYLIADVPLAERSPAEAIVAEVEAYQAQGVSSITWHMATESEDRTLPTLDQYLSPGIWLSHNTTWWLERVLGFIHHLLTHALGVGETLSGTEQLAQMLFYKRGRLLASCTHVDLFMSMEQVSIAIRRVGLDRDPGWIPDLAYIVLFHYEEEMP